VVGVTSGEFRAFLDEERVRLVTLIDTKLDLARVALDCVQITTARELLAEVSVLLDQKNRVTTIMEEIS